MEEPTYAHGYKEIKDKYKQPKRGREENISSYKRINKG
jgi:hypothetical protein